MNRTKGYAVIEYGGEWEDKWEHILGVFKDRDEAVKFATEVEEERKSALTMSREEFDEMCETLFEYEEQNDILSEELLEVSLHKMFPKYSEEEFKKAADRYALEEEDTFINVETIDLYL